MSVDELRERIRNTRIAAFDYGTKRVGWAVTDEFHITNSTKGVFYRSDPKFWEQLLTGLQRERIGFILVGVPLRTDEEQSSMVKKTREFIAELREKTTIPVHEVDEAFSSKRAVQTMIQIGVPKMQRRQRERTDEISAAILLRDFLAEFE